MDKVPLKKVKKNLNRDFADCSAMSEVIKFYLPASNKGMIDLHNYIHGNSVQDKRSNWQVLNRKVLSKLGNGISFIIPDKDIDALIKA